MGKSTSPGETSERTCNKAKKLPEEKRIKKRRKPGSAQKAANVKEQGKGREKRKKYLPLGRASIASGYTPAALAGRCPAPLAP